MDTNRTVATLAITTLLRTGSESMVDRLLRQITILLPEITDDFKVIVVDTLRALCLKFPARHRTLLAFLGSSLREEGAFSFKKSIVDAFCALIVAIPECRDYGLGLLCEFLEDCEYSYLTIKILNFLGRESANTATPNKYVRYIYNRLILEGPAARACAVDALAEIGSQVISVRSSIIALLTRSLQDADDEVRDRAALAVRLLKDSDKDSSRKMLVERPQISVLNLIRALQDYRLHPSATPFDITKVPLDEKDAMLEHPSMAPGMAPEAALGLVVNPSTGATGTAAAGASESRDAPTTDFAAELAKIPEFSSFGTLFRSTPSTQLTPAGTEYIVMLTKHVYVGHVVLQFAVTNTVPSQVSPSLTRYLSSFANSLPCSDS